MKRLALILICLLLQACSATTKGLGDSLWDSLFGTPGVQLTDDDIQNMPYASQYMQLNGGPQLFVVLAFSENGQQKWVTQDGATIVTQHGRLVKTLLSGDNLIDVNNLAADPLEKPGQIIDGATWTRTLGWTEHRQVRYATARSVFTWRGTDSVSVGSEETAVRVLDEEVTTDQTRWRNRYWVDSEGQIRQTEQYLGANYFPVKITLIKAAKS
ncbi:YjbF family lipoprotein [Salmonella enterica subsp. enterica serovar Amager]|uniref:YjbF family lipoprotein n=1 Tax=Salmonella enterica TaxID=28901 RepID=A0A5V1A467_SALER|nr:YjbF family lipoprotein [Salmonella enterica]EAW1427212.1 YjbF family lipoprotein [Salmonella enterica subsp. enterica]EBS3867356.1 YjbF family lipoprotein [Salmonella enterica subsp. enterica serovar Kimberley]ECB3523682.1 YjbF family lipoprotein [Salmonella enterica subsp. enterica serovar Singapore]ECE8688245.1 YjbF family lipoprotein [Salmonella enterica subsp. enterica serovar Kisarawe]EDQ6811104.1 YjbF family lipoprotein [Salmonella enterica subsp. enterica serovar 4,[5],12:i:-]EGI56